MAARAPTMHEASPERQKTLDQIWKIVLTAPNAAAQEKLIASLPADIIEDLRKYKNLYRTPVCDDAQDRYLQFSFIDLDAKYKQRFIMTSLIGFIGRMADEYEPPGSDAYMSEDHPTFANPFNAALKEFTRNKPVTVLSAILAAHPGNARAATTLYKYKKNLLKDDLDAAKTRSELVAAKLQQRRGDLPIAEDAVRLAKLHLAKRRAMQEAAEAGGTAACNAVAKRDIDDTLGPDAQTVEELKKTGKQLSDLKPEDKRRIEAKIRDILPYEAFKRPISHFEQQLSTAHAALPGIQRDIAEAEAELTELAAKTSALHTELCSWGADYKEHKGVFSKAAEQTAVDAEQPPAISANFAAADLEPNDDDYYELTQKIKADLGIAKTREEYMDEQREIITKFHESLFLYNPDDHVRSAFSANYNDATRNKTEAITALRRAKEVEHARSLVPPADTFARWDRYTTANYEPLRQATDDIYCERSDLEQAIVPLNVVTAPTLDAAMEKAREYQRKHTNEFEASVLTAKFNIWTMTAPFETNRETVEFLNEKTEVLRRILEQNKLDEEQGREFVKKRGKRMKAAEAKLAPGGDALGMHKAAEALAGGDLKRYGAKPISDMELPKDHGTSGQQELEIGVHSYRPKATGPRGRRVRGVLTQSKFHIPAEAPNSDATVDVHNSAAGPAPPVERKQS